jgi:hypothetical protein
MPHPDAIAITFHCQTDGLAKQGATAVDRHGERGDHPLLASVAGSGTCSTRGCARAPPTPAVAQAALWPRRSPGAPGRGDRADLPAGRLWLLHHKVVAACRKAGATYSITVKVTRRSVVAEPSYRPFGRNGRARA